MNESLPPPASPAVPAPALRLSRELAVLGARLARLLERVDPGRDPRLPGCRSFLESMFEQAGGEPLAASGPAQPLERLAEGLRLVPLEVELLLLAALPEEHEGYASVLSVLNPRGEGQMSVGLAAQLLAGEGSDRAAFRSQLLGGAALRSGLLGLSGSGGLFEQNLVLAAGLWPVLGGIDCWPAGLARLHPDGSCAGLHDWLETAPAQRARRALRQPDARVLVLGADSEDIACDRAAALCASAGVDQVAFDWTGPPAAGRDELARLHALARGAVPIFRLAPGDGKDAAPPRLDDFPGPVLLCARRGTALALGARPVLHLDIAPLSASERCALWRDALPELSEAASTLAARYLVEPAVARRIAADLRSRAALDGGRPGLDEVADCVRARAHARLTPGLDVRRPTAGWQQLVLPPLPKLLLAEALQRLQQQATVLDRWRFLEDRPGARGVRVLLCGPPGTGKTLSAEVLAKALGVDLLVVDIARLVSKWIGETEQHLAAVFDAAEHAQAVLLFDEADALFGKRTAVTDAHDRYANLETAYLLARLERFEGLVILSTNLKHNIDPAFLRRLEFVIELEQPGSAEREALWRCHLPPQAPLADDIDLAELATLYPISGGLVRNAAVAAAFLAAAAGSGITRAHLVGAIAREYAKSGKAFPGAPAGLAVT